LELSKRLQAKEPKLLGEIVSKIVEIVGDWGYFGIFAAMFLESSFFPFPSEVIMIPAGYLSFKGEFNLLFSILAGVGGSIAGALFNYYLAMHYGRKFLIKWGRYFFLDEKGLDKLERFFKSHGEISTFTGRLIPGVRQYISLPAGLAKMSIFKFSLYTALGAGIWVVVLAVLGYFVGANEALVKEYLRGATAVTLILVAGLLLFYYLRHRAKAKL
jgi:membrane protein DedA with SNARE-associated domain